MVPAQTRIKASAATVNGAKHLSLWVAPFLSALPSMALANGSGPAHGHGTMWGGWGWAGMIFGSIMMIAVLAVIVVVVVLIFRWLRGGYPPTQTGMPHAERTALDTLKERFASGEIDSEEFEEKRRLLSD